MDEIIELTNPNESNSQEDFAKRFEHFLKKTDTIYTKTSHKYLSDRGIENRLLENLLEYLPDGAVIAGGFALNVIIEEKKSSDIDFFFLNEKAFDDTLALFLSPPEDGRWAYNGYVLKEDSMQEGSRYVMLTHDTLPAVQLLRMVWYTDPMHVIDSFDFTISQFAFDNKSFYFNGASMMDLARKRLILHRMQFPASTLRRLIKYASKGYYACPGSLVTICEAIKVFTGDPDVAQVVYVD